MNILTAASDPFVAKARAGHRAFYLKTFWFLSAAIISLLVPVIAEGNGEIPSADREALIALYSAAGGDNWTNNAGWLGEAGTECEWYGIICGAYVYDPTSNPINGVCGDGNCYYLELAGNNLQGTLPYQIGNMEKLIRLNLSHNSLTGSIPAEITDIPRLYRLRLSDNSLTGSIPSGFGDNPWLTYLNLSNNQLTGSIPADLGNQAQVGDNNATAEYENSGGCELNPPWKDNRSSPCFYQLDLSNNQLSGSIPAELGNLIKLRRLYLQDNQLTGSIPPELGDLLYLEEFYLSNNQLSGSIPAELGNLNPPYRGGGLTVATLATHLDHNKLTGTIPAELCNMLLNEHGRPEGKLDGRALDLDYNSLTGPAPDCLTDVSMVNYVSLYEAFDLEREALTLLYNSTAGDNWTNKTNWLSDKAACTWFGITCTNGEITGLYLNNNNLNGSIPTRLGEELSNLEGLYLYSNKLSGSIPSTIGNLTNLKYLNLYDNDLSGSIPSRLGDLAELITFDLENNQLTGTLPSALQNLDNLTRFAIGSNTLTGPVPQWLTDMTVSDKSLDSAFMTSMREYLLDLYTNLNGDGWTNKSNWLERSGTECTWFGITCQDGKVTRIVLPGNNLTGSIPTKLGSFEALTVLDLSDNNLSGAINTELGGLETLQSLNLGSNQLSGSIPAEIGSLDNLTTLTLTGNQLSGTIPSELGLLLKLETLDISSNIITGSIPTILGSIASLKTINLSSNKLGGSIPSVLGNLSNLTSLNFSNNLLDSSVPAELGNLGNLTDFNLSNNQLSGTLPAQLGELSKLSSLNLGSNRFSGYAPEWLLQMGIEELLLEDAFASNYPPVISITGGDRAVPDTDDIAGESVSLTSTATDQDGRLVSTQWLVGGSEVGTGLTLTIALSNGATVVTFKATDNDGDSSTTTATITVEAPNVSPSVAISGGNRTITDTNNVAGESVSFIGTAIDSDGTIATTQWLVGGSVVATGLSATIALSNGATVVTFKATDNDGDSSTKTVTITVKAPDYTPAEEWPFPYSGVTPNHSSLQESAFSQGHFLVMPDSLSGLEPNNIGVFNPDDSTIYTCLQVYTEGLPGSVDGIGEFDIGFTVFSPEDGTLQLSGFREFNEAGALNEYGERPDCSGKLETTTGIYTDIIQSGNDIFHTTFSITDPTNMTLRLESYETLSH